jgi:hypothetical protein
MDVRKYKITEQNTLDTNIHLRPQSTGPQQLTRNDYERIGFKHVQDFGSELGTILKANDAIRGRGLSLTPLQALTFFANHGRIKHDIEM